MGALVRRWEPAVHREARNMHTARFLWQQKENFLRITEDHMELGATTELTES